MVDGDSQQLMVNGNVLKTPLALSVSKPALSLSKGGERGLL